MDAASADHMAGYMVDYIRGLDLFYIPTLLALFPLLDDDGRLEFQQWFHNSTTTRTALNQLQSGRLDQGDLRSNCRRGTRVDIGRHLRPSKLRPTCRCRCGSRFLRRRGRRTAATFLLSSRQTAAVKSLLVQLSCRIFHFAQSNKPTSPYPPRGRPGPKSRNRGSARLSLRSLGITMLFQQLRSIAAMPTPVDTRVGGNSHQKPPEALRNAHHSSPIVANHNGVFLCNPRHPKPARKRAFLRARARASQHGSTMYRGQRLSAQQLGVAPRAPPSRISAQSNASQTDRIHFMSWNAGSLTADRNLELNTWLDTAEGRRVGLVAVQETHWRGPLEYVTSRFAALHCGETRPEGGLLLLVSKSLFPPAQIQHCEVIPGRLLHVRLETCPSTSQPNVDVIVCYQHAWSLPKQCTDKAKHRETVLSKRAELWTRLSTLLAALPYIGIFRVLSLFAPKQPRRKLQRASTGMPLDIASTVSAIRTYYHDLYHKHPPQLSPAPGPLLQVSWAQLQAALSSLPCNEALPPHVAPSRLWCLASDILTDKHLPMLNAWLADMSVPPPEEWHVADLCLIPKPSKPMTAPEALRPISLIHPISKALSIILNNHIKPQLWQLVHDLPQMAYLEARSVQDTLDRASAHCARVRAVLRAQQQNIHLRKQGHRPADCRGGVLLSIDLRQVFDVMPRSKLQEAMDLANVDPAAQHVILQLHAHASLRVTHGSQVAMLDTDNGIRQGCCLAPSLWVLYTGLILTYIKQHVEHA